MRDLALIAVSGAALIVGLYALYRLRQLQEDIDYVDYQNYELGRYVIDRLSMIDEDDMINMELVEADVSGLTET